MKKNYLFTLLLTSCFSLASLGQVFITELADPNDDASARYVEIYNNGSSSVDLTDWSLKRYTNGGTTLSTNVVDLTPIGSLASGAFAIIAANGTSFQSAFGVDADISAGTGGPADSNGDDQIVLYNASDALVDIFGVPGEDGTGTAHEFEDGRAERKAVVSQGNTTWDESEWNIDNDGGAGEGALNTDGGFDPGAWIGATTSSDPEITITSPSNSATIAETASVTVSLVVSNFTVGAIGGSGVDGHIHWTVQENSDTAVSQPMKYNTDDETITVSAGNSYTVYMKLVDNSHTAISPAVESTVTFSVAFPCDLILGDIIATCDASTAAADTYSGTIAFTGGNSGTTYTTTAPSGVTVGGDDPTSVAAGTMTFIGMTEGTDTVINIAGGTGSSCDIDGTISSPVCVPFPIVDHFDYAATSNLADQSSWEKVNTGDEILVETGSLDYDGLESSSGNMIKFDQSGSEAYTAFSDVTTGVVYASFLFKVTGFQTGSSPDTTDGGYIAALAGSTSGYDARFWVRPNPDTSGTTFDIGFGPESSSPTFTSGTYSLNEVLFVVMAYDMDNASMSTWINPAAASFEGTIPTATLSSTDSGAPSAIKLFILRQDSTSETPFIAFDALRISDSWADVTPKDATASLKENFIEGFTTFPNPISNKIFTISTSNTSRKLVNIYNVLGKKILTQSFSGTTKAIDVSAISKGVYILKVTEGNNIATKKLVIR